MFSPLRDKWLNCGISVKIGLLLSFLVLACLLEVGTDFVKNRRTAFKIREATTVLLPGTLISQQALSNFIEQLKLYEDAIIIGDESLLEQGIKKAAELDQLLKKLEDLADSGHSLNIESLRYQAFVYSSQAREIYSRMIVDSDNEEQLNEQAIMLGQQAAVLLEGVTTLSNICRQLLEERLADIVTLTRQHQQLGNMLALWVISFALLISFLLVRVIIRPIVALASAARGISEGNWGNTLEAKGNDEVADLTRAFGTMTTALRSREKELQRYRDHLEELVAKRTIALEKTNVRLEEEVLERSQAEKEAAQARELAEAANKAKSMFLANMSHEIRTPMNAILGFTQLMQRDDSLCDNQRQHLKAISRSGSHLLAQINDILEISKIEAGGIVLNPVVFNLHEMLQDLEIMFSMRCRENNLRLVMEWPPDMAQYILSDEGKLRQVLVNFLGNAVKFTKEGGITLRAGIKDTEDMFLVVEVEDSGCGIAPDEQSRIFDAFQQTVCGIQSQGGTGLGLAISKEYIRLLGGDISLRSELGTGSLFRFTIPVESADSDNFTEESCHDNRVIGLRQEEVEYRVLLVEDRDASRAFLSQLLTLVGFKVIEAVNGLEAVELAETRQPHIVLMDLNMPVMDGYEATRRIKARNSSLPVIAVTASAFEEDRQKIMEAGCDDFIRKPFKENEIFEVIRDFTSVEYNCEKKENTDEEETTAVFVLSPADLSPLSRELRNRMAQAATTLEGDVLHELIAGIDDDFPELAENLKGMVNRYAFQELVQLLSGKNT